MVRTSVHNYSVSDFLELRAANRLEINHDFQRKGVWKTPAKVYLIDSILRGYPIPKLFFRSRIDPKTQSSVREVVDGQQRLIAIFEFADNNLRLTTRAGDLKGLRYSDLDNDQKDQFLSYTFTAEQLVGAADDEVLEVFARINTYAVALNPAELRHALWQGEFKWTVHDTSRQLVGLWDNYSVLSLQQRARLQDDALVADMMLQISQGVTGGEKPNLDKAYKNFDADFPEGDVCQQILLDTVKVLRSRLSAAMVPPLSRPAHLTMLVAALAHVLHGISVHAVGWLTGVDNLPPRGEAPKDQDQWDAVRDRLLALAGIIELSEEPEDPEQVKFWRASRSATINLRSRRDRFPFYLAAIAGP